MKYLTFNFSTKIGQNDPLEKQTQNLNWMKGIDIVNSINYYNISATG